MDRQSNEGMVPSGKVLLWLAREHEKQGTHQAFERCLEAAIGEVLDRLLSQNLIGWASEVHIDSENPEVGFPPGRLINPADLLRQTQFARVPFDFWCYFHNAGPEGRLASTVTGDFKFNYDSHQYAGWRAGKAYGVVFEPAGVVLLGYPVSVADGMPPVTAATLTPQKNSDQERQDWILAHPMMTADKAYKEYRKHPRSCGIKRNEFRAEWSKLKDTRRGRPKRK